MDKTLLVDLKKKMFIRTSLITVASIDELLSFNEYLSCDEILLEIIKKALREFELTLPLILDMPINQDQMVTCYGRPGYREIKGNFQLYLNCVLGEERIILVPNSIVGWRIGDSSTISNYSNYYGTSASPGALTYAPVSDYQRPYLYVGDLPKTDIYIKGICARPIVPDFTSDKKFNPESGQSAIYWMNVEDGGARGNYFMDLCMAHLLDYLRQLKASLSLPNMPIEIFSNIDSAYMEMRDKCNNYSLQSGWYGELLI